MILAVQLVLVTLAAYAFARFEFYGREVAFALVLMQLMIMPDVLIVENYQTLRKLGLIDTLLGIGLPYMASAFGIFLLRQTFKSVPRELDEAARIEGCNFMQLLWKVYVPLARPVYIAFGLVSVSYHWNNFLWPLIVTNSVETRPAHRRPAGLRARRPGHRLGADLRRDAADLGCWSFLLPVRAELHS
jgi:sn-glycerol 3-phosphate transport system permease protein